MTRKVSGMQCGLILFISAISLKFLVFPSLFSKYAFRDVYFSILMGIILDFIFSLIVIISTLGSFTYISFIICLLSSIVNIPLFFL